MARNMEDVWRDAATKAEDERDSALLQVEALRQEVATLKEAMSDHVCTGKVTTNDTRQMTAGEMAKGPKGPVPQSVKDACDRAVSDMHPQEIESNDTSMDAETCLSRGSHGMSQTTAGTRPRGAR